MPVSHKDSGQEPHLQTYYAHGWRNEELQGWRRSKVPHVERHTHPLSHRLGQMVQAAEGRLFAPTFSHWLCRELDLFPHERHVEKSLLHKQSWGSGNIFNPVEYHSCSIMEPLAGCRIPDSQRPSILEWWKSDSQDFRV